MRISLKPGTMMMREGTSLPKTVAVSSVPYCDHWRKINGLTSATLDRALRGVGWNLFFMAGELRTFVPGNGQEESVQRGIARLAARAHASNFNGLQLTGIVRKWSFGIPFVVFTANAFHIQEGSELKVPAISKKGLSRRIINAVC
jgi:hypothetical protein